MVPANRTFPRKAQLIQRWKSRALRGKIVNRECSRFKSVSLEVIGNEVSVQTSMFGTKLDKYE